MRAIARVACLFAFAPLAAQALSPPPVSGDRVEREAILDAARAQVQAQLGERPVRFLVKQWNRSGDWVFLHAVMQDAQGRPISYAGTRYEAADRRGQKSADYDALLQRQQGQWRVRIDSIGATDVPWTHWSRDYSAPPALFPGGSHSHAARRRRLLSLRAAPGCRSRGSRPSCRRS